MCAEFRVHKYEFISAQFLAGEHRDISNKFKTPQESSYLNPFFNGKKV